MQMFCLVFAQVSSSPSQLRASPKSFTNRQSCPIVCWYNGLFSHVQLNFCVHWAASPKHVPCPVPQLTCPESCTMFKQFSDRLIPIRSLAYSQGSCYCQPSLTIPTIGFQIRLIDHHRPRRIHVGRFAFQLENCINCTVHWTTPCPGLHHHRQWFEIRNALATWDYSPDDGFFLYVNCNSLNTL